ncbi:MAG: hypothetical protein ACFFD6_11430 [Candidatus Thorarchaeota archaeon]
MPRSRSAEVPKEVNSLKESIAALEEIDRRLGNVMEVLSEIQTTLTEMEADDNERFIVRNLILSIDAVGDFLDRVQVELDALETRISSIKVLKTRQMS